MFGVPSNGLLLNLSNISNHCSQKRPSKISTPSPSKKNKVLKNYHNKYNSVRNETALALGLNSFNNGLGQIIAHQAM